MARSKDKEYTCEVIMTEGAEQRITDALVDLYYKILRGNADVSEELHQQVLESYYGK